MKKQMNKMKTALATTMMTVICTGYNCLADNWSGDNVSDVTAPIDKAKTLLLEVVGSAGIIVIIIGLVQILLGNKNGNDEKVDKGAKTMIAGFLMASISGVLAYLGFT